MEVPHDWAEGGRIRERLQEGLGLGPRGRWEMEVLVEPGLTLDLFENPLGSEGGRHGWQ